MNEDKKKFIKNMRKLKYLIGLFDKRLKWILKGEIAEQKLVGLRVIACRQ